MRTGLTMGLLLFALSATAKMIEQRVTWDQLPASLTGQEAKVRLSSKNTVRGQVARLDAGGIVLQRRGKQRLAAGQRPATSLGGLR